MNDEKDIKNIKRFRTIKLLQKVEGIQTNPKIINYHYQKPHLTKTTECCEHSSNETSLYYSYIKNEEFRRKEKDLRANQAKHCKDQRWNMVYIA